MHDLSLGDVLKVFSVLWINDKRNVPFFLFTLILFVFPVFNLLMLSKSSHGFIFQQLKAGQQKGRVYNGLPTVAEH